MTSKDFEKYFVGFDRLWDEFDSFNAALSKTIPGYPPINVKRNDDNKYTIEMAVAGFGKTDIDIELDGSTLRIKGNAKDDVENNYLYKGIANRAFTREFKLSDSIEVKNADLVNGMLKIGLEKLAGKKVKINVPVNEASGSDKQLLTE